MAAADGPVDPKVLAELATAYVATAKYLDESAAIADGYVPNPCSSDPAGHGSMGFHYFNESLYGSVDPPKPACLLHEDGKDGKRRLVGVEWIVPDADRNLKTSDDRKSRPHHSHGACSTLNTARAPLPHEEGARPGPCVVQRTKTPAWLARFRKYCGATPSTSVTATPNPIAVMVSGEGTATVGPSGRGSLKNMSTITRM